MSLTSPSQMNLDPTVAFIALHDIVRTWRTLGRKTTTAGLKPALQKAMPGFSEAEFGFASFRDFVAAAEQAKHVHVYRLPSGHSMVLLPDETPTDVEPSAALLNTSPRRNSSQTRDKSAPASVIRQDGADRLKQDVWTTFVDWHDEAHDHLWDRKVRRSFKFPVDQVGQPAWLSEIERFARIEPVDRVTQVSWMQEWAATLPEPSREILTAALAPGLPIGQFRRELNANRLTAAWRAELQRRVVQHVSAWADTHGVPMHELLDQRPPMRPQVSPAPVRVSTPQPNFPISSPIEDGSSSDAEKLRALLHKAIDRMSLAEMILLPIRAEHFLDR